MGLALRPLDFQNGILNLRPQTFPQKAPNSPGRVGFRVFSLGLGDSDVAQGFFRLKGGVEGLSVFSVRLKGFGCLKVRGKRLFSLEGLRFWVFGVLFSGFAVQEFKSFELSEDLGA